MIIFKYDYRTLKHRLIEGEKKGAENEKRVRTPVEEFSQLCRDKLKVNAREFEYSESDGSERQKQRNVFQTQANSQTVRMRLSTEPRMLLSPQGKLKQTCEKSYGNLYEVYVHLKVG